jgi:hypothetical protein
MTKVANGPLLLSMVVISKDEAGLATTLDGLALQADGLAPDWRAEVIVVDASRGRMGHLKAAHPDVRWIDFEGPPGLKTTIPHQRNVGVRAAKGEVIAFIDSGCDPDPCWLARLVAPIANGEEAVTCGPSWVGDNVYSPERGTAPPTYVREAATINLAFRRELFDRVGGFDERFAYGSDVDFTWRLRDGGSRIRWVDGAVVRHDWGGFRRQMKRSRQYGAARIRLYAKHRRRRSGLLRHDPVPVVYAAYLMGLPLALRRPVYLLLLAVPAWRARRRPMPIYTVVKNLMEGVGALQELGRMITTAGRSRSGR